jgi:2-polyprenyl-6-methoxyphenol hydroxylase-like FAD-dependent oxidoreductase
MRMARQRALICGGGIAGLTLAICLKDIGWEPLVVEREPALRAEGYMMDFFGTGWDVAERMGLVDALRALRYPIDAMQYVDDTGRPYISVPIERIKRALSNKYVYLRRADLEQILFSRARETAVDVRFGLSIDALDDRDTEVGVTFSDGSQESFDLVFGADGVHSQVRRLVFGPEDNFSRFLGYYVAAFHVDDHHYSIGRAFKLHEEADRLVVVYPLDARRLDATFVFRHADIGLVPPARQLGLIEQCYRGAGWIAEALLKDRPSSQRIYFDPTTQIVMPEWHRGRIALLGDAAGCLTLLAGQGSHMAMAGGHVIARELERHGGDRRAAFAAYERFLKPHVEAKQKSAAWLARLFVPTKRSSPLLRRLVIRLIFSPPLTEYAFGYAGARSILADYK